MGSRPGLRSTKKYNKQKKVEKPKKHEEHERHRTDGGGETEQMNWQRVGEKNTGLTTQRLINK